MSAKQRAQDLNAFITLLPGDGEGPRVAVKDLVDVAGSVTTGGSRVFPRMPAEVDAPIIRRVRADGCVLIRRCGWAGASRLMAPRGACACEGQAGLGRVVAGERVRWDRWRVRGSRRERA